MSSIIVELLRRNYLATNKFIMLLQVGSHLTQGKETLGEICQIIPATYHAPILASCANIRSYLEKHASIDELPAPVSEIVQLVFQKIEDELTHTFKKETGIIFPFIQQQITKDKITIQPKVVETMLHTHELLIELLQKMRQLMHHYITHPSWPQSLKSCVNEMFQMETDVLRWIHFEQSSLYPQLTNQHTTTDHA